MCLRIKSDQIQNEKDLNRWFGSRKKFAYVYKVLRKWDDEDFYRSLWHPEFIWDFSKQKVYQIDRVSGLTKDELDRKVVNEGFHVYTSLEIATFNCGSCFEKIAKFRVKREDVVAIENNYNNKELNLKELVCTKLEFVRIVD
jgi:hypothetical protein